MSKVTIFLTSFPPNFFVDLFFDPHFFPIYLTKIAPVIYFFDFLDLITGFFDFLDLITGFFDFLDLKTDF